jgi:hypothetical protein
MSGSKGFATALSLTLWIASFVLLAASAQAGPKLSRQAGNRHLIESHTQADTHATAPVENISGAKKQMGASNRRIQFAPTPVRK